MAGNSYPDWTPLDYKLSGWLAGQESSRRDFANQERMGLDNLYRQGEIETQEILNSYERQAEADKLKQLRGTAESAAVKGEMDRFKFPIEKQGILDAEKLNKGMNVLRDMLETFDTTGDINASYQAAIAGGADPNKLSHLKDRKSISDALQRAEQRLMSTPEFQQKQSLQREEEFGKNWREVYGQKEANYRARLAAANRGSGGGNSSGSDPLTKLKLENAFAAARQRWLAAGAPREGPEAVALYYTQRDLDNYLQAKANPTSVLNPDKPGGGGYEFSPRTPMPNVPPGINAPPGQQAQPKKLLTPEQRAKIIEALEKRGK